MSAPSCSDINTPLLYRIDHIRLGPYMLKPSEFSSLTQYDNSNIPCYKIEFESNDPFFVDDLKDTQNTHIFGIYYCSGKEIIYKESQVMGIQTHVDIYKKGICDVGLVLKCHTLMIN